MKRIGLALVALSVAVAPSVLSENPPATCIGTETFRMQVQGSINGGQTWNSNSVSVYGYPSTQINLPIRTLMTITTGQTQGWSFSLEPDPTYLSITAVTTNGTNTATVKAGDPPDQNTTAIRSNGLAQGIVIDTSTGITLNPTTDFVTTRACVRITFPASTGTYEAKLTFTHNVGSPPTRTLITQNGFSNIPCAKNFSFYLQVSPYFTPTPSNCNLGGMWNSAGTGVPGQSDDATQAQGPLGPMLVQTPSIPFSCADANSDDQVDLSDAIYVLSYLFLGGPASWTFSNTTTRLLKTGQTHSYRINDDAAAHSGLDRSYTINQNLTVADNTSQIEWTKKAVDSNQNGSLGDSDLRQFEQAPVAVNTALNNTNFAGHNDWRVPTLRELMTIVDYSKGSDSCSVPSLDTNYFEIPPCGGSGAGWRFWSSTQASYGGPTPCFYINFVIGHTFPINKEQTYWIRGVRNVSTRVAPHMPRAPLPSVGTPLQGGNANGDGTLDLTDVIHILNYLFLSGPAPCLVDYPVAPMVAGLYIDNGDGTVTDLRTNLTWQKRPADNGANLVTWDTAIDNANSLPLANGGWRLPNVYELQSLVDFSKTTGNLVNDKDINDNDIFAMPVGTNLRFWTSTTDTFTELRAWKVNFDPQTGHHHNSSLNNFKSGGGLWWAVRSIRSGG